MTKRRTITGFAAVALLAIAGTATAMRSYLPSNRCPIASAGIGSPEYLAVDVNKLPTEHFDDQSLVYSTGTKR